MALAPSPMLVERAVLMSNHPTTAAIPDRMPMRALLTYSIYFLYIHLPVISV